MPAVSELSSLVAELCTDEFRAIYAAARRDNRRPHLLLRDFQNRLTHEMKATTKSRERREIKYRRACAKIDGLRRRIEEAMVEALLASPIPRKRRAEAESRLPHPEVVFHEVFVDCAREAWTHPSLLYHAGDEGSRAASLAKLQVKLRDTVETNIRACVPVAEFDHPDTSDDSDADTVSTREDGSGAGSESETESEAGVDTESETGVDTESESESESESETGAELVPETGADTESETGADTESEGESETETGAELLPETGAELLPETGADTETGVDIETGVDTETAIETGADTETAIETGVDIETGADTETAIETGVDTETAIETGVDTETATETGVDTETATETATETGVDTETAIETAIETGVDTETATAIETGVDTETATAIETGVDTETATAIETGAEDAVAPDALAEDEYPVDVIDIGTEDLASLVDPDEYVSPEFRVIDTGADTRNLRGNNMVSIEKTVGA